MPVISVTQIRMQIGPIRSCQIPGTNDQNVRHPCFSRFSQWKTSRKDWKHVAPGPAFTRGAMLRCHL